MEIKLDLSDLNRLAEEYRQRADRMASNPFGSYRNNIEDALRDSLHSALATGDNKPQSLLTNDYEASNRGHYGSFPQGDQSRVNPQEWLDPAGVATIKSKYKMPGPHKSMYGSSRTVFTLGAGGAIFDLTTEATMTPYPYDPMKDPNVRRPGPLEQLLPTKPIMAYLRDGWVDPKQTKHRMNPRPFGKHVVNAFKPYIRLLSAWLLLAAGFRRR